ncbi:hypothetical protein AK812_SmicGene23910 [Symbiodinium microadriaticum]|uniref:Uncharacterized protein n=1 Tax=Symbiodinium microadriaticum TaxID=2951 RepID=A0A1Q9DG02_SYMMI|nr:hypothetical protein AK812_SmicGene23910 [Symbiodinium microadriaticum]
MARLRRPESFDDVRAEGLFRTTTVPQPFGLKALNRRTLFCKADVNLSHVLAVGTSIFESTAQAEGVVFLSHRWGSARWTKYLALCLYVLWDDAYFVRLWCQLELATFAKHGGAQKADAIVLGS